MSGVDNYSGLDGFKSIYHDAYRGKYDDSSLKEEGILIKENGDGKYEIKFSLLNAEERQILREKNIDINNETTWVSLSFSATQPEYAVLLAKAKKKDFEAQIGTIRKTDSEAIDTLKERFVKELESRTERSKNTLQTVGFLKAVHDTETGSIKLVSIANSDDVLEIKRQHQEELPKRFAERLETLLEVSELAKEKISKGARNWGKANINELAQKLYKQTNNTVAYLGFTDENGASHRRLVDLLAAILKEEESANKSSHTVTLNNEENVGATVTLTPTDNEEQAKESNNRSENTDKTNFNDNENSEVHLKEKSSGNVNNYNLSVRNKVLNINDLILSLKLGIGNNTNNTERDQIEIDLKRSPVPGGLTKDLAIQALKYFSKTQNPELQSTIDALEGFIGAKPNHNVVSSKDNSQENSVDFKTQNTESSSNKLENQPNVKKDLQNLVWEKISEFTVGSDLEKQGRDLINSLGRADRIMDPEQLEELKRTVSEYLEEKEDTEESSVSNTSVSKNEAAALNDEFNSNKANPNAKAKSAASNGSLQPSSREEIDIKTNARNENLNAQAFSGKINVKKTNSNSQDSLNVIKKQGIDIGSETTNSLSNLEKRVREKILTSKNVLEKIEGYGLISRISNAENLTKEDLKLLNENANDYLNSPFNLKSDNLQESESLQKSTEKLIKLVEDKAYKGVAETTKRLQLLGEINSITNFTDLGTAATNVGIYLKIEKDPKA